MWGEQLPAAGERTEIQSFPRKVEMRQEQRRTRPYEFVAQFESVVKQRSHEKEYRLMKSDRCGERALAVHSTRPRPFSTPRCPVRVRCGRDALSGSVSRHCAARAVSDQVASDPSRLTSPSHDHCGMRSPSGTSFADRWCWDIVVKVAHAK